MANKPILIFPTSTFIDKRTALAQTPPREIHTPSKGRQTERIEDRFNQLFNSLENQRVFLQQNVSGATPELVLVLEFVGTIVNFFNAVKKIPELNFLAEQEYLFGADDDFYLIDKEGQPSDKDLSGQIFLVMTNQSALAQLQRLWQSYKDDSWQLTDTGRIAHGLAKFKELFEALKDIRPYSIQDRLRDTGFENYINEQSRQGNPRVKFEVEMFYSNTENAVSSTSQISQLLLNNEGKVILGSEIIIDEIKYHALVAEAPISAFVDLSVSTDISFLQCESVMHFRPVGQSIAGSTNTDKNLPQVEPYEVSSLSNQNPSVALLDGYPLSTHTVLHNRLIIDDPDNFLEQYAPHEMLHGTSMASLIINGELDDQNSIPLTRPLYVRPIMHPDPNDTFHSTRTESIPHNRLPVDLVHRAIVRMFDGEGDNPPTAPDVKVINLSIGDPSRPFHLNISAWAKLLDWLSEKYNILFVVSAGNFVENILIPLDENVYRALSDSEKADLIFQHVRESNLQNRKILTPGESINGLTIGSTYADESGPVLIPAFNPLFNSSVYLAPYSRLGSGYRRSIKPDVLNSGGRLLYRSDMRHNIMGETSFSIPLNSYQAQMPGQKVATPGSGGDLTRVAYTSGTSNSAALTTRLGAQLYEILEDINAELLDENKISKDFYAVLIKSLLVHGANWDNVADILRSGLKNDPLITNQTIKDKLGHFIGYGKLQGNRVLYCTDQRVTLLGYGEIKKDTGNVYSFPLPNALNDAAYSKRLIVTLAWMSPLNFNTTKYRKASLYFDNLTYDRKLRSDLPFELSNANASVKASQRGTVQHQVFEDSDIGNFVDGDNLVIKVNCKEDAGGLRQSLVKYGLAVTLELRATTSVNIYEEIKQRIQVQSRIRSV